MVAHVVHGMLQASHLIMPAELSTWWAAVALHELEQRWRGLIMNWNSMINAQLNRQCLAIPVSQTMCSKHWFLFSTSPTSFTQRLKGMVECRRQRQS